MKRLISITICVFALALTASAQDGNGKAAIPAPPAAAVKGAIAIPPERAKELQALVNAVADAQTRHQFAESVFSDACPCVRQLVAGLKAEMQLKQENLTVAILTERILRDVPKEFVLNDKWTFVPPPPPVPKKP